MSGGLRLLFLSVLVGIAAAAVLVDDASVKSSSAKPPLAPQKPVVDDVQGHKITDVYRWLEDAASPETQQWVNDEMAYTRGVLDPLPGRDQLHKRLTDLMSIGTISAPQIGGKHYFYTKREGSQNQPVLFVREGVNGKDRVLVDVIEIATGQLLPDSIERTRAVSLAWMLDNSGFYYTRYPKKGEVAEGQEVYYRHVFYHTLGSDPAKDPMIFGKDLGPEDWPEVDLSNHGHWLLLTVAQGWTKTDLYVQDLRPGVERKPPVRITEGKNFLYSGEIFNGKMFITTNEDSPHYRMFAVDAASPARANWKEIIPQNDAILQGAVIVN